MASPLKQIATLTGIVALMPCLPLQAQAPSASWLDQPLKNWNRADSSFPQLPDPEPPSNISQCVGQIRQPSIEAEKALVAKGWKLFGPLQAYDNTQLFMATSGFDGMCRPMGFQAFVFVEGRYAGTLSPVLMDSRSDGVIYSPILTSGTEITAEFARYQASDPLCCPSGTSIVTFKIRADEIPDLIPTDVITTANDTNSANPQLTMNPLTLTGTQWQLTKIGNQAIPNLNPANPPYIEFSASDNRYFGSGGCNRFTGGFNRSGNSLQLSPAASTKMACLQGAVQATEAQMFEALGQINRYQIQGQILKLYANDSLALEFQAKGP